MYKLLAHPKHFEIAFSMYDLDGSGSLDKEEFQKVMGAKKTGNGKPNIDSVWNKKSTISLQEFSTFISDLQSSIHLAQVCFFFIFLSFFLYFEIIKSIKV
mgnify:CR=1 FL=1